MTGSRRPGDSDFSVVAREVGVRYVIALLCVIETRVQKWFVLTGSITSRGYESKSNTPTANAAVRLD